MQRRPLAPSKIDYDGRFQLRPVELSDIPQVYEALQLSLPDLHPFMHWSHEALSLEQFSERVVAQWNLYFRGEEYEMALFDAQSGAFLVYAGFYPTVRLNPQCFEIGFWTSSLHAGKGYATLATQIQIVFIFEFLKGDRIEITSNLNNHASLHIIEKCGFHFEGNLRNYYPAGTPFMFSQGYSKERSVSLFSLIPEDCRELDWYQETLEKMTLSPVLGSPFKFIA